ncbi:GIY-YIG nuclease family protein [Nocardia sp. NPDC004750]
MAYVYMFRYGTSELFKVGKTNTVKSRQSTLQTGNTIELQVFDAVETDAPFDGERFFKTRWAARQYRPRSEIYRLTEAEAHQAMAELRDYLTNTLPNELVQKAALAEIEGFDNTEIMISPTEDIVVKHRRLVEIEAQLRTLTAEAEPLRREIMLAIDKNRGIEGIATYDKADANRWFDDEGFEEEYPQWAGQFQKVVFDGAACKKAHPNEYERFMQIPMKRKFVLFEDLDRPAE